MRSLDSMPHQKLGNLLSVGGRGTQLERQSARLPNLLRHAFECVKGVFLRSLQHADENRVGTLDGDEITLA